VTQGVGPEVKPWYCKKKQNKTTTTKKPKKDKIS
jgi:hypothetical protein